MIESRHINLRVDNYSSHRSSSLSKLSFYTLLLYFAIQPFNDVLHRIPLVGSYFDLLWIVVMLAEAMLFAFNRKVFGIDRRSVRSFDLKIVFAWMAYLVLCYIIADKSPIVDSMSSSSAAYFNLRFLLQSVPIFILIVVRGLNRKELNAILFTIVLLTPLSIFITYREIGVISIMDLQNFSSTGLGLYYNTYVPYTTFAFFASVYLFSQVKSKLQRILIACSFSLIAVFIFVNPSRQSVYFVLLCAWILIVFTITTSVRNLLLITIIAAIVAFSISRLDLTDRVQSRFFSPQLFETDRIQRMATGIGTMNGPLEWFFGNGLHQAIDFGFVINPHNNYIFSVMRIGLIGMILMFLPFFRAVIKLIMGFIKNGRQPWFDRNHTAFVMNSMLFVLFHSFFGYPHLDVLSGPIVWFGLAVWVVYQREIQARALTNRHVPQFGYKVEANRQCKGK